MVVMSMTTTTMMQQRRVVHGRSSSTCRRVLMAVGLLLSLLIQSAISSSDDNDDDHAYITCGSAVKIQSTESQYYLNSEKKNLGSGSGQQLVTFIQDNDSANTLWWIRPAQHDGTVEYPPNDSSCRQGQPIQCGTMIRLTHVDTLRNLHSHGVKSVLSQQQEVTGFGTGDGKGDGGDNWKVVCDTEYWQRGSTFHLHHQDTNKYLGTAKNLKFDAQTCGHNCPIMGHLEAFCRSAKDVYSGMKVDQGVHISK